MKYHPIPTI